MKYYLRLTIYCIIIQSIFYFCTRNYKLKETGNIAFKNGVYYSLVALRVKQLESYGVYEIDSSCLPGMDKVNEIYNVALQIRDECAKKKTGEIYIYENEEL